MSWWLTLLLMQDPQSQAARVRAAMAGSLDQQRQSAARQPGALAGEQFQPRRPLQDHAGPALEAHFRQAALDGESVRGLLVSSVADDGPAAKGGLQVGDVIVKVGGRPVERLDALRDALQLGADVSVLVSRGGKGTTLTLTVAPRPGARSCG